MSKAKVGDRIRITKYWVGAEGVVTKAKDNGYVEVTPDVDGTFREGNPAGVVGLNGGFDAGEYEVIEPAAAVDNFPRVFQSFDSWHIDRYAEATHKVVPIDAVVTMPEPQQGAWQVQFQVLGTKDDALAIHDLVRDAVASAGLTLRGNTKVTVDNWIPSTEKVD